MDELLSSLKRSSSACDDQEVPVGTSEPRKLERGASFSPTRASIIPNVRASASMAARGSMAALQAKPAMDTRLSKRRAFAMDVEEMKNKIREAAVKPRYDVADYYYTTGVFQHIARHSFFEHMTLGVIAFNALWISIDTDLNEADTAITAHPVFQLVEQAFCFYFSFEWFVRFMSFRRSLDCVKDAWFFFDSCLVGMMVLETWVLAVILLSAAGSGGSANMGNTSILRMARLLRLSRMARMARLFRSMPELLILIKAMAASLRSCFFVFLLLTLIMYVFAIAFRQLTMGSAVGQTYFPNVLVAMHTLWIDGTILDGFGDLVSALAEENLILVVLIYLFLLLSALTVMNMLIGVLCEVVSAVAATEKEELTVNYVKERLQEIFTKGGLDEDLNGEISKREFSQLLELPEACRALSDVGVDVFMLVDNIDFIFGEVEDEEGEEEERALSLEDFICLVLDLRGANKATVKDIVNLQKYIKRSHQRLRDELKEGKIEMRNIRSLQSKSTDHLRTTHMMFAENGAASRGPSDFRAPSESRAPGEFRAPSEMHSSLIGENVTVQRMKQELRQLMQDWLLPEFAKIRACIHQDFHGRADIKCNDIKCEMPRDSEFVSATMSYNIADLRPATFGASTPMSCVSPQSHVQNYCSRLTISEPFKFKLAGEWESFGDEDDRVLKQAYLTGFPRTKYTLRGSRYECDFKAMTQTNVDNGQNWEICAPPKWHAPDKPVFEKSGPAFCITVPPSFSGTTLQVPCPRRRGDFIAVEVPKDAVEGQLMVVPIPSGPSAVISAGSSTTATSSTSSTPGNTPKDMTTAVSLGGFATIAEGSMVVGGAPVRGAMLGDHVVFGNGCGRRTTTALGDLAVTSETASEYADDFIMELWGVRFML